MSMNFAKNARAVAFNPTSAFPLDARVYFESLEAAQTAAALAVEAGSTDGVYYFGQTLSVVEGGVASFYIIQPNGTLQSIAGKDDKPVKIEINDKQFSYIENKLNLANVADATVGQMLVLGEDGGVTWATPIDAYTKTETDSTIDSKIAAAAHLKRTFVDSKEEIDVNSADALTTIYMIPNGLTLDDDRYDEYMVIEVTIEDEKIRKIEKVGTWAVDLKDYAKKSDLNNYVTKNGTDRLVAESEVEKWNKSETNVIASASEDFVIDDSRQLILNNISITKVTNLADILNSKVSKTDESGILVSTTDRQKLDTLVIGEDGSVGVSGSINASNVKELDIWIKNNRNKVEGLFNDDAKTKLETLFDQTSAEFEIASIGDKETGYKKQLNLVSVSQDKVTGLVDTLNLLAKTTDVEKKIQDTADELNAKFADYVTTKSLTTTLAGYATTDSVDELKAALTWVYLT